MRDELLDEIYAAKKKIAAECGCDFDKLVERLVRSQEQHPELLVREVPKSDPEPQQT